MSLSLAKPEVSLEPLTGSESDDLLDSWRMALANALADERDRIDEQRKLFMAQVDAAFAALRSDFATRQVDLIEKFGARLLEIKNGEQGPIGLIGPIGPIGPIGERGEQGQVGLQGDRGERGEKGDAGEQGEQGEKGDAGEKGDKGDKGEQGNEGPIGAQGERGEKGEDGSQGTQGIQGERGESGPIGKDGIQGERGLPGSQGEVGERGLQGVQGVQGERGLQGDRGDIGPRGSDGLMKPVRAFAQGKVNYDGDIVTHLGSTYQAKCDTVHAPPHEDWSCLAHHGRNAIMPIITGTFRDDGDYKQFNIVALNGSSFIAKCDNPGACPGDNWQLIASAGKPGKPGQQGPKGDKGERGERGASAPFTLSYRIDRKAYALVPVLSDGTQGEPMVLRELFDQYNDETH